MKMLPLRTAICNALKQRYLPVAAAIPVLLGATVVGHAQSASTGDSKKTQSLETIVVTGSNIRRVDIETANPVVTIDAAQIRESGKLTVGDLVQQLPAIAGNANNPAVNNGGGSGGAFVSLRGLGTNRTLVLIDGHRLQNSSPFSAADLNTIPANMVERIEILKDGASSVYGSDAIGGVVNFIMRKNYQGAEASVSYGISDHDDGERKGFNLTFGQTTDKGSIVGGVDYNKTDGILASRRAYSNNTYNYKSGTYVISGSLASPSGLITAPEFTNNCPPLAAIGGIPAGTVDPSSAGGNGYPSGYRCYVEAGTSGPGDEFNYQAVNLIYTPQERTNAFVLGNYKLTDNVEAYLDIFHDKTTSESQVAPLPLDLAGDGVVIEQGQPYNPFGGPIGGDGSYGDFAVRLVALGNRSTHYATTTDQVIAGLKGGFGTSSWEWDVNLNYGHVDQFRQSFGYIDGSGLQASGSLSANCIPGTTAAGGCLDLFHQSDANSRAILAQYAANPFYDTLEVQRGATASANGTVFSLPAGDVSLAIGVDYFKNYLNNLVDYITVADPNTGLCKIQAEACSTPYRGSLNYKEAYAETLIPLLKDSPFVYSLNLSVGDRYSKYNQAGSTNNLKVAVEWRPIQDLLLRGTVSEVFRAPTLHDLYGGVNTSYDSYVNPCSPTDSQPGSGHDVFCSGGGASKNGDQIAAIQQGAAIAGTTLKPEYGKSFDFGMVYDPNWISGLSLNADIWRIYLNDTIIQPRGQTVADICYATNDPNNPACASIARLASGLINTIKTPVINLGRLDTKGVDFGFDYRIPEMGVIPGKFSLQFDSTYIAQYNNDETPGLVGDTIAHVAGHYSSQFGNFARWRALTNVNWSFGGLRANWTMRYVGPVTVGWADPREGVSADQVIPNVEVHYGSWTQHNVNLAYSIEPLNTTVSVGIDNLFDKQPPLFGQNNVINANVDVNTYDTIGRYYWFRTTVKF